MAKQPTQQAKVKNPKGHPDIVELGKNTQWQPGTSGNPKGSPKKQQSITMAIREELGKVGPNGKTKAQMIAEGMVDAVLKPVGNSGSPRVLSEVLNRTEGSVPQIIGGDVNKPLIIRVIYDEKDTKEDNV